MRFDRKITVTMLAFGFLLLSAATVLAGPVYQPPGANLTYGDVIQITW